MFKLDEKKSTISFSYLKENYQELGKLLGNTINWDDLLGKTKVAINENGTMSYKNITLLNSCELIGRYDKTKGYTGLINNKEFSYQTLLVYLLTMTYSRFNTMYLIHEVETICNEIVSRVNLEKDKEQCKIIIDFVETYKPAILRKITVETFNEIFNKIK